jgi:hypothetical protein
MMGLSLEENRKKWVGSKAEVHGGRSTVFSPAVVVDGAAMIIRRETWEDIGYRDNYIFHHFYDKIISCQMLEKGWKIGTLGIGCDHFSGQTVNQEKAYLEAAMEWCVKNKIAPVDAPVNWDRTIYLDSEIKFLKEFRDKKHILPITI